MDERKPVGETIKELLQEAEISFAQAAKWVEISPSTFSSKIRLNTFYAEEVLTILYNLGIEVKLVKEARTVNKKYGGVGPSFRMMVNRIIYDSSKSIALCHTEWSDGWRRELFVDDEGRFFVVHYTSLEGAKPFISEMSQHDAMMMYGKYGDGSQNALFQ